jgi:hypothetical protein
VDGTGSGSCPFVESGINGVQYFEFSARKFSFLIKETLNLEMLHYNFNS